jgi:hypothetical protein
MYWFLAGWLILTSLAHAFGAEAPKGIDVVGVGADGQTVTGEKWAVIIGINDYDTASDLQYCVADARGLHDVLTGPSCGFPKRNVRLLVDDAPDRADRPNQGNVIGALSKWLTLPKQNDLVLVYFSGHGQDEGDESYLLPSSAQESAPALTGIPLKYVRDQLRLCRAQRKLLMVDMCHGGGKGIAAMSGTAQRILAQARGMLTLASCQVEEKSYEWPDKGHSVFSYYLLEALSGRGASDRDRDGWISTDELYDYLHENVVRWSAKYGQQQTPQIQGERTGRIVLGLAGLGAPALVEDLKTAATLRVTSAPSGAEVHIGGELQGRTPCEVTIDLGAREQTSVDVIVQQTGYRPKGGRVTVRRGQTVPWDVELERLPTEAARPRPPVTGLDYELVPIPAGNGVAAFEIGKYEVTVAQFRKFVEATGYKTTPEKEGYSYGHTEGEWGEVDGLTWRNGSSLKEQAQDDRPVVHVSWEDADAFCKWVDGRLPTHGEWEHAARGGLAGKEYVWGDDWPPPKGAGNFGDAAAKREYATWGAIDGYDDGFADTAPVGSLKPNGYGLHDMAGNVWEWVSEKPGCRGGSFNYPSPRCLAVSFRINSKYLSDDQLGFRVARTP